jgi:hypothetical protein
MNQGTNDDKAGVQYSTNFVSIVILQSSGNRESPPGARIQLPVDFYLPRQAKTRVMEHMLSS